MRHKVFSFEVLSLVLQCLQNTVRKALVASVAHLTFGTCLRILEQLYEHISLLNPPNYIVKLQKLMCTPTLFMAYRAKCPRSKGI